MADDPDLTMQLDPNSTYLIEFHLFVGGPSGGAAPNNSRINATTLPVNARPSTKRTITCACSVVNTTLSSV
ncbi:hypothetical protein KBZ21_41480, partial [Streptomyces sp. A73]|nr:hypothetical protein [Streptomyces sp. A73]